MAARERAHDPYKLGRFCDEMEAFRLYTGSKSVTFFSGTKIRFFFLSRSRSNDADLNSERTSIDR